ncbi:uncharacterized protein LOC123317641 [Coccinella septempunctata]|uniref:uncharacterized protein LOC123317641 n=1 Tax=Coccinella septempunctata TaxID=41139 RepID=UPI001D08B5BF|nr:uncharacterized protein LOC123317641 [Coccinella septempunctata]
MDLEKLISLVREHDILYNFNNRQYSDANEKEKIWRNIAVKLNENAKECKKQWNSLRDGYRKNKRKRMTKSGQAAIPLKKWKFEEEMNFLDPYIQDRKTFSSIEISETEADPETDVDEISQIEEGASTSNDSVTPKRRKKEKASASSMVMDYLLKNKQEEKDDVDAFFHGLAQTVKKMSPYYRAITKARVGSVVGEMEIQSIINPNPPVARTNDELNFSNSFTPITSPDGPNMNQSYYDYNPYPPSR